MRKSKHERELMKQRQKFCENDHTWHYTNNQNWGQYLIEAGKFFKNKITTFLYRCDCSYCMGSKERKKRVADLNFKEQKQDFERNE